MCFQCVAYVEKSVSMQQHGEPFVRKQRRVELKSVGNFAAKTVLVESRISFHWKRSVGHSTAIFFEAISTIIASGKTLTKTCHTLQNIQFADVNFKVEELG